MNLNKENRRHIRNLMLFAALLVLALMYSGVVFGGVGLVLSIVKPFIYGAATAFVLNLPMSFIENKILKKWNGRTADLFKRPLSIVLSLLFLLAIISLVLFAVVPQLAETTSVLGEKIPDFIATAQSWLHAHGIDFIGMNARDKLMRHLELNWASIIRTVQDFLQSGAGAVLSSTFSAASSIISGLTGAVISFIFSLYILSQKETLIRQGRLLLTVYLPEKMSKRLFHVLRLLNYHFSKFISGQCLEALILGTMFVVAMLIFRMPYAVMVGVLIAFTSLIPVVGAFIGCVVGAFLILIENPLMALWFIVLFLVLQQIEGNLIYPRVVGNSVGQPSIWVLAAVSIGGSLMGVIGMLIFIPLSATVYTLVKEDVRKRRTTHT